MERVITLTGKEVKTFNRFTSKTGVVYSTIKVEIDKKGAYVLATNKKQLLIKQISSITSPEPYQIFISSEPFKYLKPKSNDIIKIDFDNKTLSINDKIYYLFKEPFIRTYNKHYLDDDILSAIINSNDNKLTSIKAKELRSAINNIIKFNKQKNFKYHIPYFILDNNNKIYTSLYDDNPVYYTYDSITKDFYKLIEMPNLDYLKLDAKDIKYFLSLLPNNSIINIYTSKNKEIAMLESTINSISYKFVSVNYK